MIANDRSVKFSEQQLVDCDTADGNAGCNGGTKEFAFVYAARQGIEDESSYPYKGVDKTCQYSHSFIVWKPNGYMDVQPEKGDAIKAALEQ